MLTAMTIPEGKVYLHRDRPLLLETTVGQYDDAKLTVEAQTGWRVKTQALVWPPIDSDDTRRVFAVVAVGRVYSLFDREGYRQVPDRYYGGFGAMDVGDACDLLGFSAYSGSSRLTETWRGHPAGSEVIWVSGAGGALGVIEQRGMLGVARRLFYELGQARFVAQAKAEHEIAKAWLHAWQDGPPAEVDPDIDGEAWIGEPVGICEGCNRPAWYTDAEGVPLCQECWDACQADTPRPAPERVAGPTTTTEAALELLEGWGTPIQGGSDHG